MLFDNINFINIEYFFNQAMELPGNSLALVASFSPDSFLFARTALFVFSLFLVIGIIYAYYRRMILDEARDKTFFGLFAEAENKSESGVFEQKWQDILGHLDNSSISSWTLAIIEADKLLDLALEKSGFDGETIGDKLKMADNSGLSALSDAWTAHKLRNRIAHEENFSLTQHEAREAIRLYQRVLSELGFLGEEIKKIT